MREMFRYLGSNRRFNEAIFISFVMLNNEKCH